MWLKLNVIKSQIKIFGLKLFIFQSKYYKDIEKVTAAERSVKLKYITCQTSLLKRSFYVGIPRSNTTPRSPKSNEY